MELTFPLCNPKDDPGPRGESPGCSRSPWSLSGSKGSLRRSSGGGPCGPQVRGARAVRRGRSAVVGRDAVDGRTKEPSRKDANVCGGSSMEQKITAN